MAVSAQTVQVLRALVHVRIAHTKNGLECYCMAKSGCLLYIVQIRRQSASAVVLMPCRRSVREVEQDGAVGGASGEFAPACSHREHRCLVLCLLQQQLPRPPVPHLCAQLVTVRDSLCKGCERGRTRRQWSAPATTSSMPSCALVDVVTALASPACPLAPSAPTFHSAPPFSPHARAPHPLAFSVQRTRPLVPAAANSWLRSAIGAAASPLKLGSCTVATASWEPRTLADRSTVARATAAPHCAPPAQILMVPSAWPTTSGGHSTLPSPAGPKATATAGESVGGVQSIGSTAEFGDSGSRPEMNRATSNVISGARCCWISRAPVGAVQPAGRVSLRRRWKSNAMPPLRRALQNPNRQHDANVNGYSAAAPPQVNQRTALPAKIRPFAPDCSTRPRTCAGAPRRMLHSHRASCRSGRRQAGRVRELSCDRRC